MLALLLQKVGKRKGNKVIGLGLGWVLGLCVGLERGQDERKHRLYHERRMSKDFFLMQGPHGVVAAVGRSASRNVGACGSWKDVVQRRGQAPMDPCHGSASVGLDLRFTTHLMRVFRL
jgi:hypothetical protein